MTLREMMVRYVAEFELYGGNTVTVDMFEKISDHELFTVFRNSVWDEAYTDGHVEGYFKGIDHEREVNKMIDSKARLN